MSEIDEEELLAALKKRRAAEEVRREAVELLLSRSFRNVPLAITWFALAFGLAVASVWIEIALKVGDRHQSPVLLAGVIWTVYMGMVNLRPSPRDRLLLLLAKEAVLRCDEVPKCSSESGDPEVTT
jgi:hypothetical protein